MCTTSPSAFSKSFRKRSSDCSKEHRPVKRVSFSKRDNVLGRAQDYDRTSFEVPPMLRRRRNSRRTPATQTKQTPPAGEVFEDEQKPRPEHANFSGMWRRSHGFNWASLLLFSGVDEAAIADQVHTGSHHAVNRILPIASSRDFLISCCDAITRHTNDELFPLHPRTVDENIRNI